MTTIPAPPPHAAPATVIGRDLALRDVLAEPGQRSRGWLATLYARVLVASAGPLVLADVAAAHPDLAARLARARVETITPDVDPEQARRAFWPTLPDLARIDVGAGSPHPALVVVGERPGLFGYRRPWLARCGIWLMDALRQLGHDELTLYLANAYDDEGKGCEERLTALRDAFADASPVWIGCGREAQRVLRRAGVDHVEAYHPSYAKRFRYVEEARGYADALREAGVPEGPYRGAVPPRHAVRKGEEPDLPHPFGGLPRGGFGRQRKDAVKKRGNGRTGWDEKKADVARRAYVYGDARTYKAAAEAAGMPYEACRSAAHAQDWKGQQERHRAEVDRETARRAFADEVEHVGKARRAAWKAAALGVEKVLERVESCGVEDLTVQDVERLVKCAHVLAGHREDEDHAPPEPEEPPSAETLAATFVELARVLREQVGSEVLARLVAEA